MLEPGEEVLLSAVWETLLHCSKFEGTSARQWFTEMRKAALETVCEWKHLDNVLKLLSQIV